MEFPIREIRVIRGRLFPLIFMAEVAKRKRAQTLRDDRLKDI